MMAAIATGTKKLMISSCLFFTNRTNKTNESKETAISDEELKHWNKKLELAEDIHNVYKVLRFALKNHLEDLSQSCVRNLILKQEETQFKVQGVRTKKSTF